MSLGLRIITGIQILALGVWCGAIVLAGVAAGVTFSTLGDDVVVYLERFAAYDGNHGTLAAGIVMARVFFLLDLLQALCLFTVIATMLLQFTAFGVSPKGGGAAVRIASLLILSAVVAYQMLNLHPAMNRVQTEIWQKYEAGEDTSALQARFDVAHLTAGRLYMVNLVVGLICLGVTGAGGFRMREGHGDLTYSARLSNAEAAAGLETPDLARRI